MKINPGISSQGMHIPEKDHVILTDVDRIKAELAIRDWYRNMTPTDIVNKIAKAWGLEWEKTND